MKLLELFDRDERPRLGLEGVGHEGVCDRRVAFLVAVARRAERSVSSLQDAEERRVRGHGFVTGSSISPFSVRVVPIHSPNSSTLLPSPAGTALMTTFGNMKNRRGLPRPPAGCALVTPSVATTESGRGSVATKQGPSPFGASALSRTTASAIEPTSPLRSAQRSNASLTTCGSASRAPASRGVDEDDELEGADIVVGSGAVRLVDASQAASTASA